VLPLIVVRGPRNHFMALRTPYAFRPPAIPFFSEFLGGGGGGGAQGYEYFCPSWGNLVHRIRWVLEIRAWELRGYREPLPFLFQFPLTPEAKNSKRAYIRYTPQLMAQYPSLTIVDRSLLEQSWLAGWKFGVRTCTSQSPTILGPSDNLGGGNSMPPQATQQPSEDGRLTATRDSR
jgi:hypothetical protein